MQLRVTDVATACKLIARTYYGANGQWAYEAFEDINARFFDSALPWPLIQLAITPHGHCLGLTRNQAAPVIVLHPSLWRGTQKNNPWGIDPAYLGVRYAYDVLLHECIHVSVHFLLGGATGPTSHNNPQWIAEVNRLAAMLDIPVTAAQSKTKRVKDGETSRVVRSTDSNVPFKAISTFPLGARLHLGLMDYYRSTP